MYLITIGHMHSLWLTPCILLFGLEMTNSLHSRYELKKAFYSKNNTNKKREREGEKKLSIHYALERK